MASNDGGKGPTLQNAELAAQMRAYNAGLTQTSASRRRPGHGLNGRGGSGINRGISARISPSQPTPVSNARTSCGSAVLGNHAVGARAPAVPSHGAHYPVTGRPSHAFPHPTSNPWFTGILVTDPQPVPTQASTSTSLTRQMDIGASATLSTPSFQTAVTSSQALTSVLGSSGLATSHGFGDGSAGVTGSAGNASSTGPSGTFPMASTPVPTCAVVHSQVNSPQHAAISARRPIVTNWGPDPVGPQCPAHLRQPSAPAAIAEMAQLTGIPYDELTTDGITIPAPRPRTTSQQPRTPSGDVVMSMSAPRIQQNVNPAAWMVAKESGRRHTSSEMDIDTDEETTVNAVEPLRISGNLQDSRWANPKWELQTKRPAPTVSIASAPVNSENVRPLATLKGSKWAAPSFNTYVQAAPLLSVQNGWSSYERPVPAPTLSHSHSHYASTTNPLCQTSNQLPVQTTIGTPNFANPFPQVSNPFANTSAPGQFSFSAATKPFNQTSTATAATVNTATKLAPAANLEYREKSLKDSMWA